MDLEEEEECVNKKCWIGACEKEPSYFGRGLQAWLINELAAKPHWTRS
jgi:hypothetical protein